MSFYEKGEWCETNDSVALGMREAETHQLRSALKQLGEEHRQLGHKCFMYESALKRIADYKDKHPLKDIAMGALGL